MTMHLTKGDWGPLTFDDPFCTHIGGMQMLYTGDAAEPVRFGFEVQPHQCNRLGFCHGGLLSTFLDIALGFCAIEVCGHDWGGPTINLTVDFLQGAPKGDWIESRVTLDHTTRSLMFVTGSVIGSRGKIARGTALFKQPRPAPIDKPLPAPHA